MQTLKSLVLAYLVCTLLLLTAACGGGSSSPAPDPDPPAQSTGLSGQLLQEDGARVISAASAGLQGALVSALKASNGEVQASQTVGADGRFNFKSLPSGDFLIRINFEGSVDLDSDGSTDEIEIIMPATVQGNSSTMVIVFASIDTDADGQPDTLQVRSDLEGSLGLRLHKLQHLNFKHHELKCDEDGDDELDDDEADVDADLDGIPDLPGNGNSLHGGVLHGEISAIDDTSLTVDGVTFAISDSTVWRIRGNKNADPAAFTVGKSVLVRGLWNGESWLALEVKFAGQGTGNGNGGGGGGGDDDDDASARFGGAITAFGETSLVVGANEFAIGAGTEWKVRGEATSDLTLFDIGDIVLVQASFAGGVWTAEEVKLILNLVKDDGSGGGDPITGSFDGDIEAFGEAALTVDGQEVRFDASTQWEAEGALTTDLSLFDVGDEVKVDASFEADVWTATKVTLLVNNVSDEEPMTQTFSGNIELISESSITVGSQAISLDMSTDWKAEGSLTSDLSLFDVGDGVEVDAVSLDGTVWTALEVRLIANNVLDEMTMTFSGDIEVIGSGSITVDSQAIDLELTTTWMAEGALTTDISLFDVGDEVEVDAVSLDGTVWTAVQVRLVTNNVADPVQETFTGVITAISETSLELGALSFELNGETEWILIGGLPGDSSMFGLDDEVEVYAEQQGEAWVALSVTMITDSLLGGI